MMWERIRVRDKARIHELWELGKVFLDHRLES